MQVSCMQLDGADAADQSGEWAMLAFTSQLCSSDARFHIAAVQQPGLSHGMQHPSEICLKG